MTWFSHELTCAVLCVQETLSRSRVVVHSDMWPLTALLTLSSLMGATGFVVSSSGYIASTRAAPRQCRTSATVPNMSSYPEYVPRYIEDIEEPVSGSNYRYLFRRLCESVHAVSVADSTGVEGETRPSTVECGHKLHVLLIVIVQ